MTNPDLITRVVLDETMIVPIRGEVAQLQQIFVLNDVGAFIWARLDGNRSLQDVHREIVEEFEVDQEVAWNDLLSLIESLQAKGLVTRGATE